MSTFTEQIKAFRDKVEKRAKLVHGESQNLLQGMIIDKTPINTGRAKANWQSTRLTPAIDGIYIDTKSYITYFDKRSSAPYIPYIKQTIENGKKEMWQIGTDETTYIINNVNYVWNLEFGIWDDTGSPSSQAPNGMARISIADWSTTGGIVDQALVETLRLVP
jgi:hypothetical protein